jgi:hypothetical protein
VKREKFLVPFLYLALAIVGLAIPLAHHVWAEPVIESNRMASGFIEGPFHLFRLIGMLAWILPVPAFVAFLLSFGFESFRKLDGVCFISIAMFLCVTVYALDCLFLHYFNLMIRVN